MSQSWDAAGYLDDRIKQLKDQNEGLITRNDLMEFQRIHDLNQIGGLQQENAELKDELKRLRASSFVTAVPVEEYEKLKAEVDKLIHQVKYWRIEAETDNARWLRCLEEIDRLRKAAKEGNTDARS